tara:strand:+ start:705 stop:1118 length:414 start_codon:yes stop_codon:yes gene_type:complete
MVQILDIIHRTSKKNRLNTARNYLFLTLGSTFIFACIYYVAQFIDPKTKSITKNTSSRKSDRVEDDNTDHDGGKHQIEDNEFMTPDEKLSFFACLLFSLVTQTTVGFAWFVPTDNKTRIIVFFQLITVLCITTYTLI